MVKLAEDEDNDLISNINIRQIQKAILGMCGGKITEAYFKLFEQTEINEVLDLLNVYNEFQKEQEEYIKQQVKK